jgi:hypothetical protein
LVWRALPELPETNKRFLVFFKKELLPLPPAMLSEPPNEPETDHATAASNRR